MQLGPIRSWKVGVPFVVLCIVLGLAVGFAIDKATAQPEPAKYPDRDRADRQITMKLAKAEP